MTATLSHPDLRATSNGPAPATESALPDLATIYDAIASGIVVHDATGAVIHANGEACRILKLSLDQLQGSTPIDLDWRTIREDGSPFPGENHPASVTLRTGEPTRDVVMGIVTGDERPCWILVNARPVRDPASGNIRQAVATFVEITERRAMEEAVRQSEARYRALVEATSQTVWSTNAAGEEGAAGASWWAELTGQDPTEADSGSWLDAVHPADRAGAQRAWADAFASQDTLDTEYRVRARDGSYRYLAVWGFPIREADGRVREWFGTISDISERKRDEGARRFLTEASRVLASSLDYDTTLASVARLAVPHIGDWCAVDILEGDGSVRQLAVAHVDPAKLELAHEFRRRYPPIPDPDAQMGLYKVLRTGEAELISEIPPALIEAIPDPDQRAFVRELGLRSSMVVPLVARRQTVGAITLVAAESGRLYDESDLALAQELARRAATAMDNARLFREVSQFKRTLDATLDCVFMFDPTTLRFFYVNQGAVDQVGHSRRALLRMTPLDLMPEYDEGRFRELAAPLLDGTQPRHTFETFHRHRDGSDIPVEISLQYVEPSEEAGRFVAIVRDISERRQAEQALRDRAAQLARATSALARSNRELDQFAYVASHDLKAPLRGISNLAQWLEEDLDPVLTDETRRQMELIRGRVQRMENLIDGILHFSRVGRAQTPSETVDVAALLAEVTDLLDPAPPFRIEVGPGMPTFQAARPLLQQVFMNLVGNAIKHHNRPDGRVAVTVQDAGPFYEFAIADDGPGIDPRYHDKIFVIFQTLEARDRVEGTGVGLALVKKIVEYEGGHIAVESAVGQGTTFRFTWPKQPR